MKSISLICAGMLFSGMASAALELTAPGQLTLLDCPGAGVSPLSEDVNISLTASVQAGFACNNTTIVMAACHSVGRQTSRSVNGPIPEGCNTAYNPAAPVGVQCTGTGNFQVTGPAFPTASTEGGTVTSEYPVADVAGGCTAANARTHAESRL